MELECQTATSELRRLANKLGTAKDWRLLLQLDTDDDAGMMWGRRRLTLFLGFANGMRAPAIFR